jgi:hypothetical protein
MAGTSLRPCKVCFKLYDPAVPHQTLSHTHQGQGPDDKKERD